MAQHRRRLEETGHLAIRRRVRRRTELLELLQHRLLEALLAQLEHEEGLQDLVEQVQEATIDPYTAAQQILTEGIIYGTHRTTGAPDY
jgi:putative protein kinase ArgK-like GTPase of G3E family